MKKHLILLLVAGLFAFTSCSDDDDETSTENTVIGTWTLVEINPTFWDLEACPDKPVITFNEDGTADMTMYSEDTNCEPQQEEGEWSHNSGSQYTINVAPFGSLTGTVTFESQNRFTFTTTYQQVPFTFTFEK